MIFLANADGSFASVLPESVYQGANKANEIVFIAPFARGNIVTVAYTLPNGIHTQEYVLTSNNTVLTGDFEGLNVWKGELDKTITQYSGVVTAQFFVSTGNEVEVATYSQEFTVNKGVPTNGQIISSSTLTQLKNLMVQINNRNEELDDDINGTNGLKTKVANNTEKITENTDAINDLKEKLSDIETEANDSFNPSNGSFNSSYTGQQIENSVKAINETIPDNGIEVTPNDGLSIVQATNDEIDDATNNKKPITPANAKHTIKKGLTEPQSAWSQEEQAKARETLGIEQNGGTIVVGNPNAEPTEELKTIRIGTTIYELPEGIKKVAGAIPLSTTPGVKGDMCFNTTYNQLYVCTGGTTDDYGWIKIPLLIDAYIAKPDSLEPGLVLLGSTDNGLTLTSSNKLALRAGTKGDVQRQSAFRLPVMMNMIGYAVKQGLIYPEKTPIGSGFREAWTEGEQALAMATLGKTTFLHEFTLVFDNETHIVYLSMTTPELRGFNAFKNIGIGSALGIWGVKNIGGGDGFGDTSFFKEHYTNDNGEDVYDIGIRTDDNDYLINKSNFTLVSEKVI